MPRFVSGSDKVFRGPPKKIIDSPKFHKCVTRSTCSPSGISSSPSLKKRLSKTDSTGDININHKVFLDIPGL